MSIHNRQSSTGPNRQSSTGPNRPSRTIHRDLVPHLPPNEQEAPRVGLGGFKPLIRLSGLDRGLVNSLRTERSPLSQVLDGQLRKARQRSLSTRLGLLCYEAIVHNPERDRWHLGYHAYRIPKMVRSRALFHAIPPSSSLEEHKHWREEEDVIEPSDAVTATFGWMMALSQRNERAADWVRVLRLFEQQARAEARVHLLKIMPQEVQMAPISGSRFRPDPSDWLTFHPLAGIFGRVNAEVLDCLHLEACTEFNGQGAATVAWRGTWNKRVKGRVLGAVLVRRLNRMWARLHGPYLRRHHGTAVGGKPALNVLNERALDDATVRTSYRRLGMRLGALTLRDLKGLQTVMARMQTPFVKATLEHEEGFVFPEDPSQKEEACMRYLKRAEHSSRTLEAQRANLLMEQASSLTPRGRKVPKQLVAFRDGFRTWAIPGHQDDKTSRNDFFAEDQRWRMDIWRMKETLSRHHHAYVLEPEHPHLIDESIEPN